MTTLTVLDRIQTYFDARNAHAPGEVVAALRDVPGFIGAFGIGLGKRLYTITAWEDHADIRHLHDLPEHQDAVRKFIDDDFCAGAFTGPWPSSASQSWWQRYPGFSKRNSALDNPARCSSCGAALQEQKPW